MVSFTINAIRAMMDPAKLSLFTSKSATPSTLLDGDDVERREQERVVGVHHERGYVRSLVAFNSHN